MTGHDPVRSRRRSSSHAILGGAAPRPPESRAATLRSDLAFAGKLMRLYWFSSEWRSAFLLLGLVVGMNIGFVLATVAFARWSGSLLDALVARNQALVDEQLVVYVGILLGIVSTMVGESFFRSLLVIRWRTRLTQVFLHRWLVDDRFAHLEQSGAIENIDQRISQDITQFPEAISGLVQGFSSSVGLLGSMLPILWSLGGAVRLPVLGASVAIPGYMVWVAIAFAVTSTLVAHFSGRALTPLTIMQERYEADFRAGLMRVRQYAEAIAFQKGGPIEKALLADRFENVRGNFIRKLVVTARMNSFGFALSEASGVVPSVLIAPRVLAGAITVGGMAQIANAFASTVRSLSWIANSYRAITEARAVVQRLELFDRVLSEPPSFGIERVEQRDATIGCADLLLGRPNGASLLSVDDVSIDAGERVLVRGNSGSGKSTFLRALAGLWPHGSGRILIPAGRSVVFLPQLAYLPEGDLAASLAYPEPGCSIPDAEHRAVLHRVGLASLVPELRSVDDWSRRLSPGEKQRVAIARTLLAKPDFVFLDEATSALDPSLERRVYGALIEDLPGAAIVSVAHHEAVAAFHTRVLDVAVDDAGRARLTEATSRRGEVADQSMS